LALIYYCSVLAGVASGATRAALTQHFALANNAADISAKVTLVILHRLVYTILVSNYF